MKVLVIFMIFCLQIFAIDGFHTYNTKNNPKAKGLDISIQIPKSFTQQESYRPNIALKFMDNNKNLVMVLIYKIDERVILDESNLNEYCQLYINNSNESNKNMKVTLTQCKFAYIEDIFSPNLTYFVTAKRMDKEIVAYTDNYNIYYENYLISLQTSASTYKNLKQFQAIFYQIANSVVINDKYK